jgi:hypothetical protein
VAFFGLALARLEQARSARLTALGVSILAMIAIVLSGTRSALLGLLAGAIVLAILNRPRLRARAVIATVTIAVCGALFFFSPSGTRLRARVHWSTEDVWGGARPLLWRDSLRMALHRPAAGYGPETFATEFPRYESAGLAQAYPDFYHESPHNIFLDALTTRGALGFALLLGFCGLTIWTAKWRARPELAAGFVAMLVCQQFVVFVVATALYFYLLVALLVVEPVDRVPARSLPRWLVPLSVAAGLLFSAFAVRLLVADRALAVANRKVESADVAGAAREYLTVMRWAPAGSGPDLNYSRAMAQLAANSPIFAIRLQAAGQAIQAAIRATRTSEDRQNAWYNLATLLASQNDATGVERSLRNAIAWSPNWFKPHWALAQLLEATGRHDEALVEGRLALDLDGGRDPQVSVTWQKLQGSSDPRP